MISKEIPQGAALTVFGWVEMFQKNFLIIQSFRKGGYNADLSSPLALSEAPLSSPFCLFSLLSLHKLLSLGEDTITTTASVRDVDVCL